MRTLLIAVTFHCRVAKNHMHTFDFLHRKILVVLVLALVKTIVCKYSQSYCSIKRTVGLISSLEAFFFGIEFRNFESNLRLTMLFFIEYHKRITEYNAKRNSAKFINSQELRKPQDQLPSLPMLHLI